MNIKIISASPKKRFSASSYYSHILKIFFFGQNADIIKLRSIRDYNRIAAGLDFADVLIFVFPVYVDAIPSTLLEYLYKLQLQLEKTPKKLKVYAVNGCGFYEGRQCGLCLYMLKNWCIRCGLEWCGGLGIGAGEMLNILRFAVPAGLTADIILLIIRALFSIPGGSVSVYELLYGFFPWSLTVCTALYLIFSLGIFINLFSLSRSAVIRKYHGIKYTTVWFCPRFLFVVFASLWWWFAALFGHRVMPWSLFRRQNLK